MEIKRDSFIFYRSFMEALSELKDEQYAKVFRAITKFALDGKEIKLTGIEKVIFQLIKPQLIANQKRYDNGCRGGRKKTETEPNDNQNGTESKPNKNQTITETKPNENDNENVNVNENYLVSKKESKNINNSARESYEQIMEDFGVSGKVKPTLWEFIQHCLINKQMLTNSRLEDLIIALDKYEDDEQINMLKQAINGGFFDIKKRAVCYG